MINENRRRSNEVRRGRERFGKGLQLPNTPSQRSNLLRTRRGQDLASLPTTSGLYENQVKGKLIDRISSLRRQPTTPKGDVDEMSFVFRNIEQADEVTLKRILEGQINRISRAHKEMPPLSKVPRRDVEFVVWTGRREREKGVAGEFGHVSKDGEVKIDETGKGKGEGEKKENKLRRLVGTIKGRCGRKGRGRGFEDVYVEEG